MKYTRTRLLSAMALSFSSLGAAAQAPDNAPSFTPTENTLLSPAPQLASGPLFPGVLGQALADFDNDGDLDLFVTNSEGLPNYLYLNDGNGHFHDVATQAGVALPDSYAVSVGIGDFNNDGRLDILVGRQTGTSGKPAHPVLLQNMGKNANQVPVFADVSDASGLSTLAASTRALGFAVADYNQDGALDMYIAAFDLTNSGDANLPLGTSDPNVLLINKGNRHGIPVFSDRTESAGVAGLKVAGRTPETSDSFWYPHTWSVYASDVDANGLMDIIVMNESPGGVEVYLNQGDGRFSLLEDETLLLAGGWMGIASTDFDGNGTLDYFITNLGAEMDKFGVPPQINIGAAVNPGGQPYHFLLSGTTSRKLVDIADSINVTASQTLPPASLGLKQGLQAYGFGWGATFFDADNDGYKDLYWVGAHWAGMPLNGIGRFLHNIEGSSFADMTDSANLFNIPAGDAVDFSSANNGYSVLSGDIDNDGDSDLVVVNGSDSPAPNATAGIRIFRNINGNNNRQVSVSLHNDSENHFGIGGRVELYVASSDVMASWMDEDDADAHTGDLIQAIIANYKSRQLEEIVTTRSAFSAAQPVAVFGLPVKIAFVALKVTWPDGYISYHLVSPHESAVTLRRSHNRHDSRDGKRTDLLRREREKHAEQQTSDSRRPHARQHHEARRDRVATLRNV